MTDTTPDRRPRFNLRTLGWPAIVAATIVALFAAGIVLVLAGGSDDGSGATVDDPSTGTLELTPVDEAPSGDALQVPFRTQDGGDSTLAQVIDGPTVVNLFASWCPPCVGEMPAFEDVHQALGDQVRFFGLAVNDRPEDAKNIVEQTGITYDWGRDVNGDVANTAGVLNMPTTLFIDADGTIVERHTGALDAGELRKLIEEHLGVTG